MKRPCDSTIRKPSVIGCAIFALLLIATISPVSSANAQFITAHKLVQWMQEDEKITSHHPESKEIEAGCYIWFILGVIDSRISHLRIAPGVTIAQVVAIVTKYLKENPQEWNQNAADIVWKAVRTAFPQTP